MSRESSVNVISLITICVKCEIREWQFYLFIMILSDKLINFSMISREIAEMTLIRRVQEMMLQNWTETWFHEMLKIAFEHEFSVNVNFLNENSRYRTEVKGIPWNAKNCFWAWIFRECEFLEREFWSETYSVFCEMLRIAFEHEFSVKANSLNDNSRYRTEVKSIPWNAKNCYWAWIFRECELVEREFTI